MERVRILKDIFINSLGRRLRAGEETQVPSSVAERHVKTGFMKIIPKDAKPEQALAPKTKKK